MAKQRHLDNAPIIEAMIDVRVIVSPDIDLQKFSDLSKELGGRYPKNEPRRIFISAFSFGIEEGKPFMRTKGEALQGYIYKSEDEKNIAQFKKDGFTFSRLKPYTEWSAVSSEARELWELYSSKLDIKVITRIATRYINRLDIKLPIKEFDEYITAAPRLPESLPQETSQFFTRMVIHEGEITANIVQTLDKNPKPGYIGLILDIEVFEVNKAGFDKENMWLEFNKLRTLKDSIFFESITEKTARLFE